ncbi:MAG: TIGR03668 family PPOX class F420-dependent oxidoreductase [Streptosporangiaceae bacterium]|jgi:PPOX class probable F420-dependent enzyme
MKLDSAGARRLLSSARVARLATVTSTGRPQLVPVTFAMEGDCIYFAVDAKPKTTPHLQRLRNIRANPRVAVLADYYDEDWTALWWARADGSAVILAGAAAQAAPVALLAQRYPQYRETPPAGPVIRVAVERWTGWTAAAPPPAGRRRR